VALARRLAKAAKAGGGAKTLSMPRSLDMCFLPIAFTLSRQPGNVLTRTEKLFSQYKQYVITAY
jgi:hypothetical protein